MIVADDGGAQVSVNGGATWTTYHNQPTAQFYRVTTDNAFPYRIYGAQQDNSTVRIRSRGDGGGIDRARLGADRRRRERAHRRRPEGPRHRLRRLLRRLPACESTTAPARRGTSTSGPTTRSGHGGRRPEVPLPVELPDLLLAARPEHALRRRQRALQDDQRGPVVEPISPDLTRNDKSKLGPSGGPITKDNTSVEYYCTIFAALESPHEKGVLWCGSDDGLVHLSPRRRQELGQGHAARPARVEPDQQPGGRTRPRRAACTSPRRATSSTTSSRTCTRRPTTARPGRRSSPGSRTTTSPASSAPTRSGPGCSTPAPRAACTSRSTTGPSWQRVPAQPADRADHRPGGQGRRPGRGHAGAVVLGARRPDAAAPAVAGGDGRSRCTCSSRGQRTACPAAGAAGTTTTARRGPLGQNPPAGVRDPLPPEGRPGQGRRRVAGDRRTPAATVVRRVHAATRSGRGEKLDAKAGHEPPRLGPAPRRRRRASPAWCSGGGLTGPRAVARHVHGPPEGRRARADRSTFEVKPDPRASADAVRLRGPGAVPAGRARQADRDAPRRSRRIRDVRDQLTAITQAALGGRRRRGPGRGDGARQEADGRRGGAAPDEGEELRRTC